MNFRGPKAHPNRGEKAPRRVGSEPGDRQDWQRISGKMRRKSMPVLSVPGALVGGDEVSMAVFHELSRAEGPSQQTRLPANFRQSQPEIRVSLVNPRWDGLRNEPNSRIFRFGRIGYGGVHVGLVLPAESLAAFQFPKVGEEGSLGIDDVTVESVEGFGVVGESGAVVDEVGGEEAVAAKEPAVFGEDVDEKAVG